MDKKSHYFKQVDLLVRLLPLVGEFDDLNRKEMIEKLKGLFAG